MKLATFLSLIGLQTYKPLASLVAPSKPGEKKYAEVVEELKNHYYPQPSKIMQRFRFHTRMRKNEEAVATYLHGLVKVSSAEVQFQRGHTPERSAGINEDSILKRLLSETKLTYESAVKKAQAMEAAMEHAKEMQAA